MRTLSVCLLLSLALPTSLAAQSVFKCTQENGNIEYSDRPCSADPAKVETIDTSESLKTGSGGSIAEQGEFAQMNSIRRNCTARIRSIEDRHAGQLGRVSREIEALEKQIAGIDYRLQGSTLELEYRRQISARADERRTLEAEKAESLAAAQKECDAEIKAEQKRQTKAQAQRDEDKRAAEAAAAAKAAEEQRRAEAEAKAKLKLDGEGEDEGE